MLVRSYADNDKQRIIHLVAEFRVALAQLKSLSRDLNLEAAREELEEYQKKTIPNFLS